MIRKKIKSGVWRVKLRQGRVGINTLRVFGKHMPLLSVLDPNISWIRNRKKKRG